MIFIQSLRSNDVNPNGGKQIEFGKAFFETFGWTSGRNYHIKIHYKSYLIETSLKVRGSDRGGDRIGADCKEYANEKGEFPLKSFFINKMCLSKVHVGSVHFILESLDEYGEEFNLYFVPSKIPLSNQENESKERLPLQQIIYGAPGTGKSHTIDIDTNDSNRFRTTFHPDYDYATFVGAYKPTVKTVDRYGLFGKDTVAMKHEDDTPITEDVIIYKFIPQVFIKAYVEAWRRYTNDECTDKDFYLVIEEINRGNCAQIFGDLFQLLDRTNEGFSSYAVETESDLQKFLTTDEEYKLDITLTDDIKNDNGKVIATAENVMNGKVLVLPPNLHIWATMNTSDQSLFPIDSAFKRRWDWKYVPISDAGKKYKIEVNKTDNDSGEMKLMRYDWWQFLEKVNEAIDSATSSEDKKLGYFFCKANKTIKGAPEPTVITADRFVSKVLFYLYNDVFKDYDVNDARFKFNGEDLSLLTYTEKDEEKKFRFSMFFDAKGDANEDMVVKFIENLKIEGEEVENSGSDDGTIAGNFQG